MEIFPSLPLPSQCCVFISFSPSIRYISPFLPFCYSFSPPPTTLSCSSVSSTMLFLSIRFTFFSLSLILLFSFLICLNHRFLSLTLSIFFTHTFIFLSSSLIFPLSIRSLSLFCLTCALPLSPPFLITYIILFQYPRVLL